MVVPSTRVTVTTGSKLFVGLITTSHRAVLPTSPTKSSLHVTDSGCSPALVSRSAMSVCRAPRDTVGLPSPPIETLHPDTSAPSAAAAPTAAVSVRMDRLLGCLLGHGPGVRRDHNKL